MAVETARRKRSSNARKDSVIQTRVDPKLKEKTEAILGRLGLSTSDAIRMFLEQVSLQRGIPFDVKLPADAGASETSPNSEWGDEAEQSFQDALKFVDENYGRAMKRLSDIS